MRVYQTWDLLRKTDPRPPAGDPGGDDGSSSSDLGTSTRCPDGARGEELVHPRAVHQDQVPTGDPGRVRARRRNPVGEPADGPSDRPRIGHPVNQRREMKGREGGGENEGEREREFLHTKKKNHANWGGGGVEVGESPLPLSEVSPQKSAQMVKSPAACCAPTLRYSLTRRSKKLVFPSREMFSMNANLLTALYSLGTPSCFTRRSAT